jgi:hypothetical protein
MYGIRSGWRESCRRDEIQVSESCALLCVPFGVTMDPLTWVSKARVGRGGLCLLFNEPYVHQSFAQWETMPRAKTIGVAHSSSRPIPGMSDSSTLVVLWIFLLSL